VSSYSTVEGGGFAGSGGPGDNEHAVGLGHQRFDGALDVRHEAKAVQTDLRGRFVEDTHDDLLAVEAGKTRDTHVVVLVAVSERNTTVLGDAPFGDVHFRHDLATGDNRGLQEFGDRHDFAKNTVDPEPDPQVTSVWLDVDVGCTRVDRLHQDGVDQSDNRGLVGIFLTGAFFGRLRGGTARGRLVHQALELTHIQGVESLATAAGDPGGDYCARIRGGCHGSAVTGFDGGGDVAGSGGDCADGQFRRESDFVGRDNVAGVGHCHKEDLILLADRNRVVFLDNRLRHDIEGGGFRAVLGQVDIGEAFGRGPCRVRVQLRGKSFFDHDLARVTARRLGCRRLVGRDQTLLKKNVDHRLLCRHRHAYTILPRTRPQPLEFSGTEALNLPTSPLAG